MFFVSFWVTRGAFPLKSNTGTGNNRATIATKNFLQFSVVVVLPVCWFGKSSVHGGEMCEEQKSYFILAPIRPGFQFQLIPEKLAFPVRTFCIYEMM